MTSGVLVSITPEQTQDLARGLGARLQAGDVVLLRGDLGAGKTCFTEGLWQGLGGAPGTISSPSFALVHEHRGARLPFAHIDLYRLAGVTEALDLGLEEVLGGPGVCVVEWPERLGAWAPKRAWDVRLDFVDELTRRVEWREP